VRLELIAEQEPDSGSVHSVSPPLSYELVILQKELLRSQPVSFCGSNNIIHMDYYHQFNIRFNMAAWVGLSPYTPPMGQVIKNL